MPPAPRRRSIIVASRGYKKIEQTNCPPSSYVLPNLLVQVGTLSSSPVRRLHCCFLSFFCTARERVKRAHGQRLRGGGGPVAWIGGWRAIAIPMTRESIERDLKTNKKSM